MRNLPSLLQRGSLVATYELSAAAWDLVPDELSNPGSAES